MSGEHSNKRQRLLLDDDDDETNPPNRIDDDDDEARSARDLNRLLSDGDLPSGVVHRVLSFLGFADRQELTLVNQRGLREVEAFSKRVYEKIKAVHTVDETFDERVCDQSNIRTTRVKPVFIPYRYRVRESLQKHAYAIILANNHYRQRYVANPPVPPGFLLSSSGKRLAVWSGRAIKEFVDLSTKTVFCHDILPVDSSVVLYIDEQRIITFCRPGGNRLRIWTQDLRTGSWNGEIIGRDFGDYIVVNGDELFFFKKDETTTPPRTISYTMNIRDRSEKKNFALSNHCLAIPMFFASDDHHQWLISYFWKAGKKCELHIFDLGSNEERQFLPDTLLNGFELMSMKQASDCSTIFYTVRRVYELPTVIVWNLDGNGCLSERFRFPVDGRRIWIVAASKSRVFVQIQIGDDNVMKCYEARSGQLKQTYGSCDRWMASVISNNRKELLYTYAHVTPDGNTVNSIRAFCLEEPRL